MIGQKLNSATVVTAAAAGVLHPDRIVIAAETPLYFCFYNDDATERSLNFFGYQRT